MVLSEILQSLAHSQAPKLFFKQRHLLMGYAKQSLACRSCQHLRILSSFHSENSMHPTFVSDARIESRAFSSDTKETVSTYQTLGGRIKSKVQYFGWLLTRSSILQLRARAIYGYCTDDVDYKEFFKVCNMDDTFQSWFLVIHLHIWMCYVRLNLFGDDGKAVNQKIAELMWEDIRERIKQLGVEDTKARKEGFKDLAKQFYGLTIAYNKALMSENEKELPDVLFKTFFVEKTDKSRRKLDVLVKYVDAQLEMLDNTAKEELLGSARISWTPLNDIVKNSNM